MSRMGEIVMEIEELLLSGRLSNELIAKALNVPVEWVDETEERLSGYDIECETTDGYDDSMDGDHESALASVGWGTDEDYGYADEVF